MGLEAHCSYGLAPCWVAEKLQQHTQEKHWRGLWPRAVHRGALYYPIAVKPGCRRNQRGHDGNGCYTMQYVPSASAENSKIMSYSLFRRF